MSGKKKRSAINWVTDSLGVGPAPMSYVQMDALKELGVGAILNLCAEFPDLPDIQREYGFDVFYLPVHDEEAPELAEMEKALAWLDEAIYLGKKTYIHCRHGIGRTGTLLNAYLLRRGLGHRAAYKKLKKLRSKPESFDQWWSIRKYGRKSGKLTVRQPSLESSNQVDLAPFFMDYEELVAQVEELAAPLVFDGKKCGCGHDRCCRTPVSLSLIEGVYIGTRVNLDLCSADRLKLIERAAEVSKRERLAASGIGGKDFCLSGADTVCPLLLDGVCMLFDARPLQCRTFDLESDIKQSLWEDTIEPDLDSMSSQVFFAFVSEFPLGSLPRFSLPDVISGRYVQTFFHWVMKHSG